MRELMTQLVRSQDRFGYRFRFAFKPNHPGKLEIGVVDFKTHNLNEVIPENCGFEVDRRDMQSLMDMLWDEGFRPTKMVVGKDEELFNAVQSNLDDLRFVLRSK